jgi:ketosteroid isomerase-like protein
MRWTLTRFGLALLIGLSVPAIQPTAARSPAPSHAGSGQTAQERIAQRDIQEAINQWLEFAETRDIEAISHAMTPDFELHLLDGTVLNRQQVLEGIRQEWASVLRVSDETAITIESLELSGPQVTVYTRQHYVRYLASQKDGSPHEVITNVRHCETRVFTSQGWITRRVEEIEQGQTTVDGEAYHP